MAIENLTGFEAPTSLTLDGYNEAFSTTDNGTEVYIEDEAHGGRFAIRFGEPTGGGVSAFLFAKHTANGPQDELLGAGTHYYSMFVKVEVYPDAGGSTGYQSMFIVARTTGLIKMEVRLKSDGKIGVWNAAGVQVGSDSAVVFSINTWTRFDVLCGDGSTATATDGPYEVKVAGTTIFSGTMRTHSAATGWCIVGIGVNRNGTGEGTLIHFDDLVIRNDAYQPGDAAGEYKIGRIDPGADSTPSQWVPLGGAAHYAEVDDWDANAADDGTTSYLSSSGASPATDEDIVALEPPASADPDMTAGNKYVYAVKPIAYVRDPTVLGVGLMQMILRSGGTDSNTDDWKPDLDFRMIGKVIPLDPDTSAQWIIEDVFDVELGFLNTTTAAGSFALQATAISLLVLYHEIEPVVIAMDAAQANVVALDLTVSAGAVAIAMDALQSPVTALALTVVPGLVQIGMNAAGANAFAQDNTFAMGAIMLAIDAAIANARAEDITIVPGGVSIPLAVVIAHAAARALTINVSGAQAIEMGVAAVNVVANALQLRGGSFQLADGRTVTVMEEDRTVHVTVAPTLETVIAEEDRDIYVPPAGTIQIEDEDRTAMGRD